MRKYILITFILISQISFAQKEKEVTEQTTNALYAALPKVNGKYEFSEVVQLDSTYKKDMLYKNSKLFFADAFKSAKDVLQYDDREEGKVIGKGNFVIEEGQAFFLTYTTEKWHSNFSLEIFSKDGRYRYRMYDFNIESRRVVSGGNTADNVNNYSLSLDEAYKVTEKGVTKKMNRKLFSEMISRIHSTISELKVYMAKKESSSNSNF